MGTIQRGNKAAGGQDFVSGTDALASEVNTDLNTIYTEFNTNIENENVAAAANIAPTKLDDHSSSDANQALTTDPGDSATQIPAVLMTGEIQTLRHQIREASLGSDANRNTNAVSAGWFDSPARAGNHIVNGNFVHHTSGLPTGWTNFSTATLAMVTTDPDFGVGNTLRITAAGSTDEGITQTLAGLRASSRYLVGCAVKCTAGHTFTLRTTGADGAVYGDLEVDYTGTDYRVVSGVIQTDDAGPTTDIVLHLLAAADGDIVFVRDAFCIPCDENYIDTMPTQVFEDRATVAEAARWTNAGWTTLRDGAGADITVSVTVPAPGYKIAVDARVSAATTGGGGTTALALRLRRDAATTDDQTEKQIINASQPESVSLGTLFSAPVPGTTYAWTVEGMSSTANNVDSTPSTGTGQTQSYIRVTMIPPS
jgi:hypothetical protein